MGQKINPNIFRLGINKKWKTEFFEKKRHELPLYTFKDLEVKSYVERFLETQGILLHDYKQHYSNSTLNLYISYFVSSEFVINKTEKLNKITLLNPAGTAKIVTDTRSLASVTPLSLQTSLFKTQSSANYYIMRKYLNSYSSSLKLSEQKLTTSENLQKKLVYGKIDGVLNRLFKVLNLFTNNRLNIIINFCCLNKNLSFLKRTQKKNFILLQKFKGTPFLKDGIELLFHTVYSNDSAILLAKFIGLQMKKIKRHKFFLSFLKQTLIILVNSTFSRVKGIKIIIKGRLNGVPRAKHKIITIGDVPVQSLSAIVDHAQVAIHNSNGSYGIKVWIVEKE